MKNIVIWGEDGQSLKDDIAAYDFLRSKGYCLPFMGEDAFKEGWAVPATVNQPQS